jgi:hypothetical protein
MSRTAPGQSATVQVGFRVSRETADMLNELAARHVNGLRGLILEWLAGAGYKTIAQRDLARPDGRRRRPLLPAEVEPVTEC